MLLILIFTVYINKLLLKIFVYKRDCLINGQCRKLFTQNFKIPDIKMITAGKLTLALQEVYTGKQEKYANYQWVNLTQTTTLITKATTEGQIRNQENRMSGCELDLTGSE